MGMPVRVKRRRYLKIQVASNEIYTPQEVDEAIKDGVLSLYGVHGLSKIEPSLIEFYEGEQTGIVRCSHLHLRRMRASLAYVTSVGGSAGAIHILKVSGTIKALKKS